MRFSGLIPILLPLSAVATPLPYDIANSYQRRAVIEPFLEGSAKTPERNTAPSSASSHPTSEADDLGAPLLSGPRSNSPEEHPEPHLDIETSWFQRKIEEWQTKWRLNYVYAHYWFDEFEKMSARARDGLEQGTPPTFSEFMKGLSAKNEELWEADNAVLVKAFQDFHAKQDKKIKDFEESQKFKAQKSQGSDERFQAEEAERFHAARDEEWEKFLGIQKTKLDKSHDRYRVVYEAIENAKSENPESPRPEAETSHGSTSTPPAGP